MTNMIKVVAAKKETTYNVDAAPTLGANAVLLRNFQSKPLESDRLERPLERGTFGANASGISNERKRNTYEIELAGSGAAGTAAAWHEHLEACGMKAAALTATVKAEQKFTLPTDAQSSITIDDWVSDQKRKMTGARGTFGLDFTAGAVPFLNFDMMGLIPAATPFSTNTPTGADFTRWKAPVEVNMANTALTLDGFAAITRSIKLSANVGITLRNLIGSRYVNRGNHAMTGQIVIETPALATKDYMATLRTSALVALSLIHGTATGNVVELAVAALQITDITESEEDDKQMWTLDVACTVNVGSDDFTIISR